MGNRKPIGSLTLRGLHSRIVRDRGKASEYECIDCGEQARDWSWIHDTDKYDIGNYEPRCSRCHKHYDGISAIVAEANKKRKGIRYGTNPGASKFADQRARGDRGRFI